MSLSEFFKAIPHSFYSNELYRDVHSRWQGFGFLYLFFVHALILLPFLIVFIFLSFGVTLEKPLNLNYIIDQLPEMYVKGGEIEVKGEQPKTIHVEGDDNAVIAIIDTTRSPAEWNTPDFRGVIVGKRQIYVHSKENETRVYDIPPEADWHVTHESVREITLKMLSFSWLVPVLMYPFLVGLYFVIHLIQMLWYGVFGLIFGRSMNMPLTYTSAVRLASIAITPVLLIYAAAIAVGVQLPLWITFPLAMFYLFFAVRTNKANA